MVKEPQKRNSIETFFNCFQPVCLVYPASWFYTRYQKNLCRKKTFSNPLIALFLDNFEFLSAFSVPQFELKDAVSIEGRSYRVYFGRSPFNMHLLMGHEQKEEPLLSLHGISHLETRLSLGCRAAANAQKNLMTYHNNNHYKSRIFHRNITVVKQHREK